MLTELETRILTWFYQKGSKLFTIPFQWKDGKLRLKEHHRLFCPAAICSLRMFIFGYYCIQLRIAIGKKDINGFLILGFGTLIEAATVISKANIWIYRHEFTRVVNQVNHLNRAWGQTFLGLQFIISPKREKLLLGAVVMPLTACWCCFFVAILTRNEGYSYYQLFRSEFHWSTNFFVFLLFLIIQTFSFYDSSVTTMLNMIAIYSGCATMNFWLHQICVIWPKTEALLYATCLAHYKGIYILNQDSNYAFGKLFIPFLKLMLALGFMCAFFGIVRMYDDLDPAVFLLVAFAQIASLLILFPMALVMSSMFDLSKQFSRNMGPAIQLVNDKKRKSDLTRGLKSCALIRCQVGNLYHMEAKARLTLLENVIHGSLFLLINVKK